jgi:Protein of unknown function (DUF1566)
MVYLIMRSSAIPRMCKMKNRIPMMITTTILLVALIGVSSVRGAGYTVVDTNQGTCFGDCQSITCPDPGENYYGQDAQYMGNQPGYVDNGDGTVTDLNTGLIWQQDPGEKMSYDEATSGASSFSLAGYTDWRLPTIKELYSLILFSGFDVSSFDSVGGAVPFMDTDYFEFEYGDTSEGERVIDSQMATSTLYVGTTMGGNETMFGVNFADGRIKGYPKDGKTYFVYYVRGDTDYGTNSFTNNGDGTISDESTGLMWMQVDSGDFGAGPYGDGSLNWEEALGWAEDLDFAGHNDWRLPDAKELQSIVDYTRSPDTTGSAAIDPIFSATAIINEGGKVDYPFYWSGTTHKADRTPDGTAGVYIIFGRGLGYMNGEWQDVHGAGAQRSDPKSGDPDDYPTGNGPQGDAVRIYNYVRCVRSGESAEPTPTPAPPVLESGDYDGDGVDDIAVFRASSGLWSIRNLSRAYFGGSGDVPISGDYNGDGTTDISLYRGSSGLWAVKDISRVYFGSSSDTPIPADYDGDGYCDMAIFRDSSGLWAIRGVSRFYFGTVGDRPVPGYYNGGGTVEPGIFRESSGLWAIQDVSRLYFGTNGDEAVPGDYTGDGGWEIGVFRPASGLWAIRNLTRSYFGGSSDEPVPADYDGDGNDDLCVFRESSGLWAIEGVTRVYYGTSGDVPVTR